MKCIDRRKRQKRSVICAPCKGKIGLTDDDLLDTVSMVAPHHPSLLVCLTPPTRTNCIDDDTGDNGRDKRPNIPFVLKEKVKNLSCKESQYDACLAQTSKAIMHQQRSHQQDVLTVCVRHSYSLLDMVHVLMHATMRCQCMIVDYCNVRDSHYGGRRSRLPYKNGEVVSHDIARQTPDDSNVGLTTWCVRRAQIL